MDATEEDFDIISDNDSEDLELNSDLDDDEDDDVDDEVDDEVDDVDDDDEEEAEEDAEDEAEEEAEEAVEEEAVEEEVVEEEEAEVEDEAEEVEDEEELSFKDLYNDDEPAKATRRAKTRIERYCKSLNETNPREVIPKECLPSSSFSVLKNITTEKNALAFSSYIKSKRDLYQICGKLLTKEIGNKEIFQELKKGVNEWNSDIYKNQRRREQLEIRILTTKMDVVEGLYKCRRCGSEKTYSRQVQTRSADEGMTSIIQCSKCSLVWREYA